MRFPVPRNYVLAVLLGLLAFLSIEPLSAEAIAPGPTLAPYFWQTTPVGNVAQLDMLFCRNCPPAVDGTLPLMAVLRDTLGDADPENDRLTSVWLLTYSRPDLKQRVLSATPFFYWRIADGSAKSASKGTAPLLDLTTPRHPAVNSVEHGILQWALLDPSTTPIRATSRAYRTNEVDRERLYLEEAVTYLRASLAEADHSPLTTKQLNMLIARLELRKTLLGGFVSERYAAQVGAEASIRYERIRSRNWELLRECADKTGLYFETLNVAGAPGQYAILWFPVDESRDRPGTRLSPIWKLLNIKNPWQDARLKSPAAATYSRDLDADGNLLPPGVSGVKQLRLVPLSVYSLNYPKQPLLLVDFRDRLRVRWHEMTQRSIDEVTAGVIGISHFTNWYYYVAADLYNFIASRHGAATNQADRLDCYSQFRVSLALDTRLDARLRRDMQQRVDSLSINPLESAPQQEMTVALDRYATLQAEAASGQLLRRVDKNRRAELAEDSETKKRMWSDYALHVVTLGTYTHRAKPDPENLARLDSYRRAQYQLDFLDRLSADGTAPEVAYDSTRIQHSIAELKEVMPQIESRDVRAHATFTLNRIRTLSQDSALQNDCSATVAFIENGGSGLLKTDEHIEVKPVAVRAPTLASASEP